MIEDSSKVPLLIFAKFLEPGRVKTRLAAEIGDDAAVDLAIAFLRDGIDRWSQIEEVSLWLFGNDPVADRFSAIFEQSRGAAAVSYRNQGAGSLGERLRRAFADPPRCAEGDGGDASAGTLAIGADTPHFDREQLLKAAASVRSGRGALVPAEDGGFSLIGLPCGCGALEAIFPRDRWGTSDVLDRTRNALEAAGIAFDEYSSVRDIDELEDLLALWELLQSDERLAAECQNTVSICRQIFGTRGRFQS